MTVTFPENPEDIEFFISEDPCTVKVFCNLAPVTLAGEFTARLVPIPIWISMHPAFSRQEGAGALSASKTRWAIISHPLSITVSTGDTIEVTWQGTIYNFFVVDCVILPMHTEITVTEHS